MKYLKIALLFLCMTPYPKEVTGAMIGPSPASGQTPPPGRATEYGLLSTLADLFFWGMGSNGYKALSFHLSDFPVNNSNLLNLINQYIEDYPVHIHMTITQNQGNTYTATITNALYLDVNNTAVPLLSKPISINLPGSQQALRLGYIAAYVGDIQDASEAYTPGAYDGTFRSPNITCYSTVTTIAIYIYNGIIAVTATSSGSSTLPPSEG